MGRGTGLSHGVVTIHENFKVQILLIEDLHIMADGIDKEHEERTGFPVDEVLVLSKHASSSQVPSLTLHAIGVPGETPHGERARSGGIKGKAVPPSTRFGDLFRTMKKIAKEASIDGEYDITLEATHHGPLLDSPTLYLEIGSDEERWADPRAGRVWAQTISICLGMSEDIRQREWPGEGDVMIGLGGGHYAPRHKALISETEVWVGHILANYSIVFEEPEESSPPSGPWEHSVRTAVESTRAAFPGGNVFAHLDRKSFKAWQRQALSSLLSELDVPVRRERKSPSRNRQVSGPVVRGVGVFGRAIVAFLPFAPRFVVGWVAKRYMAGETLEQALQLMTKLSSENACFTVDVLGEEINSIEESSWFIDEYERVLDSIAKSGIDANISIKPTALGLLIDRKSAYENIERIVRKASENGIFVRLDMEDSRATQATIDATLDMQARGLENIGLVLQGRMFRTPSDISQICETLGPTADFRICKGIYLEPPEVAHTSYHDIVTGTNNAIDMMLESGAYTAIASHDLPVIDHALKSLSQGV